MDKSLDEVIASGNYKFKDYKRLKRVDKQRKNGVKTNNNDKNEKPYERKLNVGDLREFIKGTNKGCADSQTVNSNDSGYNIFINSKASNSAKGSQKTILNSQPTQLAVLPTFFLQSPQTSNGIAIPSLGGCVIGNSNAGVAAAIINQQRQLIQQQQLMQQQLLRQQINQKQLAQQIQQQQLAHQLRQQLIEQQQQSRQQQLNQMNGVMSNNNSSDTSVTISIQEEDLKKFSSIADLLKLIESSGN